MNRFTLGEAAPSRVVIREVGPRDGFQAEDVIIPTDMKLKVIGDLARAGITHIQAVSFVHPKRVPQMADAEQLMESLEKQPGVVYSGLALNPAGVKRAAASRVDAVEISISASDSHSRKNTGMGRDEAMAQAGDMISLARDAGLGVIAGVQCAFGCVYQGSIPEKQVLDMVEAFLVHSPQALCIADTTGMAGPLEVGGLMSRIASMAGDLPVFLHLHDTRGLGLVNMTAAIMSGIHHFDASLGGMGGCPFVPGAAGNIPTGEALYLMERLGIATGAAVDQVAACTRALEIFLRRILPGRIHRLK